MGEWRRARTFGIDRKRRGGHGQVQVMNSAIAAVMLADPFPGQAQPGGRRFHVGRRKGAGAGELDAFGANAVQEPRIGADHAVGGLGVDEDGFKDVGVGEQVQELDLRDRVPERVD
jgi:hypothetical protein